MTESLTGGGYSGAFGGTSLDLLSVNDNTFIDRLLHLVRGGPNFRNLVAVFAGRTEKLVDLAESIRAAFDLDTAVGEQLDVLGSILQRRRLGLNNATYRRVLKVQVQIILSSQGTPAQVLEIVRLFTEQEPTHYAEHYPMGYGVGGVVAPGETQLLVQLLEEARLAAYNGTFLALEPEVNGTEYLVMGYVPDSTVFLSESIGDPNNWTALADDLSSNDDDLDNVAADHADEDPHNATTGLTGDRCIEALVEMRTRAAGLNGWLCIKKDTTGTLANDERWSVFHDTLDRIRARVGDGAGTRPVVAQVGIPSISASLQQYWIAWSDEANPDTTGASDARLSTLRVWRIDSSGALVEYVEDTGTHAEYAHDPTEFVVGAILAGGTNPWEGDGTLELLRISDRPRSRQEIEAELPPQLSGDVLPVESGVMDYHPGDPITNAGTMGYPIHF